MIDATKVQKGETNDRSVYSFDDRAEILEGKKIEFSDTEKTF